MIDFIFRPIRRTLDSKKMKRLLLLTALLTGLTGSLLAHDSIPANLRSFDYKNLCLAKPDKKGKIGRSTLTGFCIGAGIGVLIGFASGNDPKDQWVSFTAGQKALGLGIFGGTIGTIAGLIVGVARHKTKKTRH